MNSIYPEGFNPKLITVGLNSTKKALKANNVTKVFLAADADPYLQNTVRTMANDNNVQIDDAHTMAQLGSFCGIEVPCAVCAVLTYKS